MAALLIAGRIALPSLVQSQVNRSLNRIQGFVGHVDGIHMAIWRGAYVLRGVRILKKQGSETDPFFSARSIEFSIAGRELIHGKFVGDIVIDDGRVNFLKAATPESSQLNVDRGWRDVVRSIFPIDIMRLEIKNGRIHYLDRTAKPVVDVYVENLQFVATGLRNRPSTKAEEFPAHFKLTGDSIGEGKLSVSADGDPLAADPHFEVHGQIENVSLPALNPFLKAYAGVQMNAGSFKLYGEMAARDGRFDGYVKPFFIHVKFTDITQFDAPLPQKVWQALASGLVLLFKNKPEDELATRIPFSGETGRTQVGMWKTVTSMLHNGFIHALPAALEHTVKSGDVPPAKGGAASVTHS